MSRSTWFKVAVVLCTLMVALGAVAANGSGSMSVTSPLQLNGKQIAAGDYKVVWTGDENNLKVTIKSGNKEIATGTAKMVERPSASPYDAVVQQDGKLSEIHFDGKKKVLVFNN